jgi:flagellar biosynthesis/type III secretory pathway protein FliH
MDPAIQKVQEAIDFIQSDEALFRTYLSYEKAERDEISRINGARREGLEKGLEKGLQKGLQKGLREGLQKGRLEMAQNLKKIGVLTPSQIQAVTGLSPDEIAEL